MSDLRLITILPPQAIPGVQQPQIAGNSSTAQPDIANLTPGSVLSGFIINRDSSGNPVLRTDSGDITFSSNFFLKIGSEITIRIEHIAGGNSAHILSVNGQPPEIAVLQSGLTSEPEIIVSENLRPTTSQPQATPTTNNAAAASAPATSAPPPPTIIVTGTIISPAVSEDLQQAPSPLQNGTQLALKITNLSVPAQATTPIPTPTTITVPAQPTQVTQETPQATVSAQPQQQPAQPPTTPSYASYARFISTPQALPATPVPTPTQTAQTTQPIAIQTTPPQVGQQIITTVISNDPGGEAILQSPLGIIRLQTGTQLPIGSHVTFEIAEIKTAENTPNINTAVPNANAPSTPAPITQLARSPGALNNIFTLLSGLGTTDALNFVNNNIPTLGQPVSAGNTSEAAAPHNFLASIMGFAGALRSGDFQQWLGRNNAKWLLDNGHENLLKKAEGEFMSLARGFTEPPAHQWQSLFFPIAVNGELQQTRLFVKRDRKEKDGQQKQRPEDDTRFVLEMDMSQLGQLQMDGFVRRKDQNIQFDLVIRSFNQLSQEVQKDIMFIYNDMGELTGYKGSLIFQNVNEFPVNPMEEIAASGFDDVVA